MNESVVYLQDLEKGMTFESAKVTLTKEEMIEFASKYDPQPMHLSDEGGKASFFGHYLGSGWQTLCTTIRLMVEAKPLGETSLVGIQLDEIKFLKPLLPNAELQAKAEVIDFWPSKSDPNKGYIRLNVMTYANGAPIISQKWVIWCQSKGHAITK
jgi:acyl dehydratase